MTIDLENLGRFLTMENSSFDGSCGIEGVTIRRGSSQGHGGAILVTSTITSSQPFIARCTIAGCHAGASAGVPAPEGGAIYVQSGSLLLYECELFANDAFLGGAVSVGFYTAYYHAVYAVRCTVAYNVAELNGGGIYSRGALRWKDGSIFRNVAKRGGAAALDAVMSGANYSNFSTTANASFKTAADFPASPSFFNSRYFPSSGKPVFAGTRMMENNAWSATAPNDARGGALSVVNREADLEGLIMERNHAAGSTATDGGAVWTSNASPDLIGCILRNNETSGNGGAIATAGVYSTNWEPINLTNCALCDNTAAGEGGAISASSNLEDWLYLVRHCTLTYNHATTRVIDLPASSSILLERSIVWYNRTDADPSISTGAAAGISATQDSIFTRNYLENQSSIPQNSPPTQGNLTTAPAFAWDHFHILRIDSTQEPAASNLQIYDIDLEPRSTTIGTLQFIGCDEWQDTDEDGLPDWFEKYLIDNSLVPGSDVDPNQSIGSSRFSLAALFRYGDDPAKPDSEQPTTDTDGDGLSDLDEATIGTSTGLADTDGDGLDDGTELADNTDPKRFNMPTIQVMQNWRDIIIEDWRDDDPSSPNNLQWWPIYSRNVTVIGENNSEEDKTDWSPINRNIVEGRIPNIYPTEAANLFWDDTAAPLSWGTAGSAGTHVDAWMLQAYSHEAPYKVHSIRAKTVKVFLKSSRAMPLEFRAQLKITRRTRSGVLTQPWGNPTILDTLTLLLHPGATTSSYHLLNPSPEAVEPMSVNQERTVGDAHYTLDISPYPYELYPLPPPAIDPDFDGLPSDVEESLGTDPLSNDTDGDGRPDFFDFLPPQPTGVGTATVTGAGSASPLATEPPIIEYIFRDGHVCPYKPTSSTAKPSVQAYHWKNGGATKRYFPTNPPASPITAIKDSWDAPPVFDLNFPSSAFPRPPYYYGTSYGEQAILLLRINRPYAAYPLRSYTSLGTSLMGASGDASEVMVRIRHDTAADHAVSKTFTLIDRQKVDSTSQTWNYNGITDTTLTINPSMMESQTVNQPNPLALPEAVIPTLNKVSLRERILVSLDLFVDNLNVPYESNGEALGISNFVTTVGLPEQSEYAEVCDDPENFRLQADLLGSSASTVTMELRVIRDGSTITTHSYTLDKKLRDKVRGRFLRLVADTHDNAASGVSATSDPNQQTILGRVFKFNAGGNPLMQRGIRTP